MSLQFDLWLVKGPLYSLVDVINIIDVDLQVRDLWINGDQNFSRMATVISDVLKSMIIVVLFSIISHFDDYVTWDTSPTRCYSFKLAYLWLL